MVENDRQLQTALAVFGTRPEAQLRYAFNSIRCNDATWKQALRAVLDRADAVVMVRRVRDRMEARVSGERLVGMLLDAANADREPQPAEVIQWARSRLPLVGAFL
jgi:hypothetical protein